ncbi:MAG: 50S ribosomal protein L18 [Nitrososphaerales archaeon]|nr:50S ribosomal protein L18 [Nitrososphaerales archaeon]
MSHYVRLQRRRREGVTDFRARKKAIISRSTLLVVRVSDKNVSAQFVKPKVEGDTVLSSAHSRQLRKLGWQGSLKSTPACYLLGMLAGKKALQSGVKEAVLYNGMVPFIKGSRVAAFVKGVLDSGISIPFGEGVAPSEERLTGKTIADYASKLAKEDKKLYQSRFSALLKRGFRPEEYPSQFEKAKAAIRGGGPK